MNLRESKRCACGSIEGSKGRGNYDMMLTLEFKMQFKNCFKTFQNFLLKYTSYLVCGTVSYEHDTGYNYLKEETLIKKMHP